MNIKPFFIGPKAENIDLYEKLIVEIVRDSGFMRKFFHPEDKPLITEEQKLNSGFLQSKALLIQEFNKVNSELKKGVPTYHPRHIGHMFGDLLIPALLGYISTILNNPNNVVGEVSPITTKMEMDFIQSLGQMVGYDKLAKGESKDGSWGHLTNGGTTANIEALWLARNLKYFPVSLKLLISNESDYQFLENTNAKLPSGKVITIQNATPLQLFNLTTNDAYSLIGNTYKAVVDHYKEDNAVKRFDDAFEKYSVQGIGVAGIHNLITELPFPKVFVAQTTHYSWKKAMDVLGLGKQQLISVKVDDNFRIDINDLEEKVKENPPVLAVVSIMGTTEEGVIDPFHKILQLRKRIGKDDLSFFTHIDAAYGGYFLSLFHNGKESKDDSENKLSSLNEVKAYFRSLIENKDDFGLHLTHEDIDDLYKTYSIDNNWHESITQTCKADSITIDPHKLGYVPYPAGSVLFKNAWAKKLLVQVAPYLASSENPRTEQMFLGKWSLEGSRPGASATACYLSSKVLPLNQKGYGILMASTMVTTSRFIKNVLKDEESKDRFKIIPLYKPDTNIFCYLVTAPGIITEPKWLNTFTESIFNKMSAGEGQIAPDIKYIVSKSDWGYSEYQNNIDTIWKNAGINYTPSKSDDNPKLTYLRSTFMNPLSIELDKGFYDDFFVEIKKIAEDCITDMMLEIIKEKNDGKYLSVLWIENEEKFKVERNKIVLDNRVGKYFNIDFHEKTNPEMDFSKYKVAIVDLNLATGDHTDFEWRQTGYSEIRELQSKGVENILIFSSYLNNDTYCDTIKFEIKRHPNVIFALDDSCLIKKATNIEDNVDIIINKIFSVIQKNKP